MSEKAPKPAKAKKPKGPKAGKSAKRAGGGKADPGVLGNLPASRPARIGGRQRPSTAAAAPEASAPTAAEPAAAPSKPRRAPAKRARVTGDGKAARSAKDKPATPSRPKATTAAAGRKVAPPTAAPTRPRPVRAGTPALAEPIADAAERAGRESPEAERRAVGPPMGPELVTTAIQAAGELAQIGVSVWTQTLRRAIERLPKP